MISMLNECFSSNKHFDFSSGEIIVLTYKLESETFSENLLIYWILTLLIDYFISLQL